MVGGGGGWFPSDYLVSTQQSFGCFVVLLGLWLMLGCDNMCKDHRGFLSPHTRSFLWPEPHLLLFIHSPTDHYTIEAYLENFYKVAKS